MAPIGVGAAVLGALSGKSPQAAAAGVAVVIIAIFLIVKTDIVLAVLLAGAAMMSRPSLQLGGVNLSLERVLAPTVVLVTVVVLLTRREEILGRLGFPHFFLGLYVLALLTGGIFDAPDSTQSLRLTVLVLAASSPLWGLPMMVRSRDDLSRWIVLVIGAATVEVAFGVVLLLAGLLGEVTFGLQQDNLTSSLIPYGTMVEGNIFGSLAAAAFVLALSESHDGVTFNWPRVGACVILLAGLVASLSRGAWLGCVAGLVTVFWYQRRRGAIVIFAATIPLMLLVSTTILAGTSIGTRASTISALFGGSQDSNLVVRAYTYSIALADWRQHPIFGLGAGSFGQAFNYSTQQLPAWVGNLEIHALHDAGVVGLTALTLALALPLFRIVRLRRGAGREVLTGGVEAGILGACVSLLVAWQSTEGSWLAYGWLFFGLAAAATSAGIRSNIDEAR